MGNQSPSRSHDELKSFNQISSHQQLVSSQLFQQQSGFQERMAYQPRSIWRACMRAKHQFKLQLLRQSRPHQRRKSQHQPQSREPLHLPCLNKRDQSLLWHPNSRMTEQMMMTMRPPASRRLLTPSTSKSQPPLA